MTQNVRLKRGEVLQAELHRFYLSLTRESAGEGKTLMFGTLTDVKRALDRLLADGWRLSVSANGSLADKAGIDFVWSHPLKGWFALDAKAVGTPSCGLIHLVQVANNKEAGECQQLCFENKRDFVELLVSLSDVGQPIEHEVLAAPQVCAVNTAQLLGELKSFHSGLLSAAAKTQDPRFAGWADNLMKAIGYCLANMRTTAGDTGPSDQVQAMAAEALREFMVAFFDPKSAKFGQVMKLQACLNRSADLQYLISGDQLKVRAGKAQRLVVLTGLARIVGQMYQQMYSELLTKHSTAEWLLLRRRVFETKGVECAIHHILDSFQCKRQALARAA